MRWRAILLICLMLLIATQAEVQAYTDPGSGTLIWQMLVAASVGLLFYLRRIILWARGLFGKAAAHDATAIEDDIKDGIKKSMEAGIKSK